jgi:hypothetical protein
MLNPIKLSTRHNYTAFFLTFACNLSCPYCINWHNGDSKNIKFKHPLTITDWIIAANRLVLRDDLPLTLQGGEPTLVKGFYQFVNEVKPEIKFDLMTNLGFDVDKFIENVPLWRFDRVAEYAPIRVSYHPGQNKLEELIVKYFRLTEAGFRVGLYGILHPDNEINKHILQSQEKCLSLGIDFRTKDFLGEWNGELYGTFKFKDSVEGPPFKLCECRTTELIVDPYGYIYKCHSDLYHSRDPISHILSNEFQASDIDIFRSCGFYGDCNPCDVKIKTNRFQQFGHTSVEIQKIGESVK